LAAILEIQQATAIPNSNRFCRVARPKGVQPYKTFAESSLEFGIAEQAIAH
jgi:hypothetical protein